VGCVREEDFRGKDIDEKNVNSVIAFVNFDGDSFSSANSTIFSVCDAVEKMKLSSVKSASKLIELGAKAIVLFYETSFKDFQNSSLLSAQKEIVDMFNICREEFKATDLKLATKKFLIEKKENKINKKKFTAAMVVPTYKRLDFIFCYTFAELNNKLKKMLSNEDKEYFNDFIPIIVVENVLAPGVIPSEPLYEEVCVIYSINSFLIIISK
jgi:hypothetical protein